MRQQTARLLWGVVGFAALCGFMGLANKTYRETTAENKEKVTVTSAIYSKPVVHQSTLQQHPDKKTMQFKPEVKETNQTLSRVVNKPPAPVEDNPNMTSQAEFTSRLSRVQNICKNGGVKGGGIMGVFEFNQSKVLYCFVPKAGCTFWKRIFVLMKNETPVTKESIDSVPRPEVHKVAKMGEAYRRRRHDPAHYPVRFLVSRDPFSRLVSTYLDKIYLPDFWSSEVINKFNWMKLRGDHMDARRVLKQDFLRKDMENIHALFDNETESTKWIRGTIEDKACGKYVTFSDFVLAGLNRAEPHWMPITSLCDPCQLEVTHVSRMETFTKDAAALLSHMGVHGVMEAVDHEQHINDELRMIVEYNYKITFDGDEFERPKSFYTKCVTPRELAYRLWNNFRWRGYIHPDVDYAIPTFKNLEDVKEDLMAQLMRSKLKGAQDVNKVKNMKKQFTQDMFNTLPKDLLEKVLQKYKTDIELFGYEDLRDKYVKNHRYE